jgi:heme/copper-type cytochrome/quinol oxidase subunit 2
MGLLAAAIFEVSISVGEHTTTSTHVIGLSIWGFVVLVVVVIALIIGFVAWLRRRQRRTASGGTG